MEKALTIPASRPFFMLCISPQNSQIQMASMSLRTVSWIMRSEPERLPPPTKKAMRWRPQKPTWWPFLLKTWLKFMSGSAMPLEARSPRTIRPTLTVSIISSFMAAPAGKAAAGSLGLMSRSLGWMASALPSEQAGSPWSPRSSGIAATPSLARHGDTPG